MRQPTRHLRLLTPRAHSPVHGDHGPERRRKHARGDNDPSCGDDVVCYDVRHGSWRRGSGCSCAAAALNPHRQHPKDACGMASSRPPPITCLSAPSFAAAPATCRAHSNAVCVCVCVCGCRLCGVPACGAP